MSNTPENKSGMPPVVYGWRDSMGRLVLTERNDPGNTAYHDAASCAAKMAASENTAIDRAEWIAQAEAMRRATYRLKPQWGGHGTHPEYAAVVTPETVYNVSRAALRLRKLRAQFERLADHPGSKDYTTGMRHAYEHALTLIEEEMK